MRAGFGTYVPPNRRGATNEPARPSSIVTQPLPKSLLPTKNRQETLTTATQLEPVLTIPIAKPLPVTAETTIKRTDTRTINEPAVPAPKNIPIAQQPIATLTSSSSSSTATNETIKDGHTTEKKGKSVEQKKRKPAVTGGVYVPPGRRSAAAAVSEEAVTEAVEGNTKKRKNSTDDSVPSAVHPISGDVTEGLSSSSSKSQTTKKRGRGFQKLSIEQAHSEQISERNDNSIIKSIHQSESDQFMEGTSTMMNVPARPEIVFLDDVSASQRMIFHSLGIVVKKTTSS